MGLLPGNSLESYRLINLRRNDIPDTDKKVLRNMMEHAVFKMKYPQAKVLLSSTELHICEKFSNSSKGNSNIYR